MYIFAVTITIVTGLVGLEWLVRNCFALRVWQGIFRLTPEAPVTRANAPLLSVVVAAKDEQDHIGPCIESLLRQDYPSIEIIVVDDRSEDNTADIIREIQARDSRVRSLKIDSLPEGWCGKNHAMQHGIARASGEWICMTDADCRLDSPRTLAVAMHHAMQTNAAMLSLLPTMTMVGLWEKFLQPILSGVLMIWFPPKKVNDPARPEAYANGMFMLLRRDAYQTIGTHEAIRSSLIEDMDLARNIKSAGLKLQMVPTRGLFSVRMYTSLGQIIRGWVRIFHGCFGSFVGLAKATGVLVGRGLTPTVGMSVGFAMYATGVNPTQWWLACGCVGAAGLAAQLVMICRYYRYFGTSWQLGCFYPLGCSIAAGVLVGTMFKLRPGAKMTWRGTEYRAG